MHEESHLRRVLDNCIAAVTYSSTPSCTTSDLILDTTSSITHLNTVAVDIFSFGGPPRQGRPTNGVLVVFISEWVVELNGSPNEHILSVPLMEQCFGWTQYLEC